MTGKLNYKIQTCCLLFYGTGILYHEQKDYDNELNTIKYESQENGLNLEITDTIFKKRGKKEHTQTRTTIGREEFRGQTPFHPRMIF